jgi:integrase
MSRKTGQIIARGDSRWLVRVYLGRDRETGKRAYHNRTIYGSLRHAQAYLTRRLHERDVSRGVAGLQISVDEFLDHWLKTAVNPKVRGKTYSGYAAMLRRYVHPAIGTRMLASLSPLEIQAAYQAMIDRKLSARTIRYAHSVLRAAIRQAIRWQLLLADPTQGVQLPSPQCREMSVLTTEQARTFLKSASLSPHGCLFAVALTSGMRPSEYLGLCWRDIDWDRGTVSIVRTIHKHEGLTRSGSPSFGGRPKGAAAHLLQLRMGRASNAPGLLPQKKAAAFFLEKQPSISCRICLARTNPRDSCSSSRFLSRGVGNRDPDTNFFDRQA